MRKNNRPFASVEVCRPNWDCPNWKSGSLEKRLSAFADRGLRQVGVMVFCLQWSSVCKGRQSHLKSPALPVQGAYARGLMITISNQKIAGFEPRWADFRGYSLLFDNPGDSLMSSGALLNLDNQIETEPALGFYRALNASLLVIGREMLTRSYLFCPLPPASYHVTVWDGGNDANVAAVVPPYRADMEAQLKHLPPSLAQQNPLTDLVGTSSLAAYKAELTFRFDRLVKWGNSVLVARLMPSEETQAQFQELVALRSLLSAEFAALTGLNPSKQYTPHVSLGYFANQEAAQQATPCVEEWSEKVREHVGNQCLRFCSVGLYGFTDMAHFFKTRTGGGA